jgi:hypothetical protein
VGQQISQPAANHAIKFQRLTTLSHDTRNISIQEKLFNQGERKKIDAENPYPIFTAKFPFP